MTTQVVSASGQVRTLPDWLAGGAGKGLGLDAEGRIVVHEEWMADEMAFGLTLCCNAYDKGFEDGVYCRACYGGDEGNYLFKFGRETFVGLDPMVRLQEVKR